MFNLSNNIHKDEIKILLHLFVVSIGRSKVIYSIYVYAIQTNTLQ